MARQESLDRHVRISNKEKTQPRRALALGLCHPCSYDAGVRGNQ
jgi:hypothetical protein